MLELNTLSVNATRQLDNTYYSVLEKLSTLHNTISSLKELANMTRKLNEDFKVDSAEVVKDVTIELDRFEGFGDQERKIEALAARVKTGRERIKTLGSRVNIVRERVSCWEQAEMEWKEKTRKRLRIMWTGMFIFAFIMMGLAIFQYSPAKTHGPSPSKGLNASGLLGKIPDLETLKNETWSLKRETEHALEGLRNTQDTLEEDPRLRVFDEL